MLLAEGQRSQPKISRLKSAVELPLRILVLCTGNSARSIMAESIFNSLAADLFQAYSAGSSPTGKVHPMALEQIGQLALPESMIVRSKSWQEFTDRNAPEVDLLLTVCDNAAAETCPTFAGQYEYVHWSFPDPAGSSNNVEEERAAFTRCFNNIKARVETLVANLSTNSCNNRATIANVMRELS